MDKAKSPARAAVSDDKTAKRALIKRRFFDYVFIVGFLCCLVPGPLPQYSTIASMLLLICITVSFFDENFYVYMAIFIYLRYRLLVGETPAFRIYSYLLVLRLLKDLTKIKFQAAYLPALFVFLLHSVFAMPATAGLRAGLNIFVDCALAYLVLCRVFPEQELMRKFMFVFLLGGIASGIYGWTSDVYKVDINISGAGAHTVSRNFGALSDSNFAGLLYSLCIVCAITLKGLPVWLRGVFVALFGIMLLQTASLSALLVLTVLSVFLIILKYRSKAFFILLFAFVGAVIVITVLLSIPQFRQIEAISGLLIRFHEKLSYISRGRLDLLTTGRSDIWAEAAAIISSKGIVGKLIGGSVITVAYIDTSLMSIACHNSYLQGILNFGVIGTLLIYIPLFVMFAYRMMRHFTKPSGYEDEDLRTVQLSFAFAFIVFGFTVDFFIDWPFMLLYFI